MDRRQLIKLGLISGTGLMLPACQHSTSPIVKSSNK